MKNEPVRTRNGGQKRRRMRQFFTRTGPCAKMNTFNGESALRRVGVCVRAGWPGTGERSISMENQAVSGTKKAALRRAEAAVHTKGTAAADRPAAGGAAAGSDRGYGRYHDGVPLRRSGHFRCQPCGHDQQPHHRAVCGAGTGGAVVVSQFLGAREQKEADASSGQLLLLSGVFGLLVGAFCLFLQDR
mgnify:CR=1 FL=1